MANKNQGGINVPPGQAFAMTFFDKAHLYGVTFSIGKAVTLINESLYDSGVNDVEKSLVLLELFKVRLVSCEKNSKGIVKMSVQV